MTTLTYNVDIVVEVEVVPAAYRVESERNYCLVIATSHQEALEIGEPEFFCDITKVSGPYPVKPNGVYVNREES